MATSSTGNNRKRNASEKQASDGNNYTRISKDDLYMIIALWMEDIFQKDPKERLEDKGQSYNEVGAVLVLPNSVIYAADCSRDGLHAVQRLLLKHYDRAEGSTIFLSRKPCPKCAKLLVQTKVKQVSFLPSEPEYYPSNEERQEVDNLFTANALAQKRHVLQVTKAVLDDAEVKTPLKKARADIDERKNNLDEKYSLKLQWKKCIKSKLPWPAFNKKLDVQVQTHFANAMEWIARIQVLFGCGFNYSFEEACIRKSGNNDKITFKPVRREPDFLKKARRFITIARFLSQRTDDPKAGVGAVIVNAEMEILTFGWNGFPLEADYGEFPRAPGSAKTKDKKTPYIIHAEQNALLMRNEKCIKGSTLFVSGRPPCNECTPLIAWQGVKTVVIDTDKEYDVNEMMMKKNEYTLFPQMVNRGDFDCYRTKKIDGDSEVVPKKLKY